MGRSGTTLIEKLLSNHPEIDILSQPFPLVFVSVKAIFLETLGIKQYYVLNDDIQNRKYEQSDFDTFLANLNISKEDIANVFIKMKQYSGQYTRVQNCNLDMNDKYFHNMQEIYEESFNLFNVRNKRYQGSKETMCEEFLPYLCNNGVKSIVIVRDPRDVVASANYPKKDKYYGYKKPTLFILRTWRKSIEYVRLLRSNPNFHYLTYEGLVANPYGVLNQITTDLGVIPFERGCFDNGIYDRDGKPWMANTSFNSQTSFISSQSVGIYGNVLSDKEINYIESICKYEMEMLGYSMITRPNKAIIRHFRDYGIDESAHLNKNLSSLDDNIEQEIKRYERFKNIDTCGLL